MNAVCFLLDAGRDQLLILLTILLPDCSFCIDWRLLAAELCVNNSYFCLYRLISNLGTTGRHWWIVTGL